MNNNLTNQENAENKNTPQFTWETPVLYTEEWLNTLSGGNPIGETDPDTHDPS